jgi:hypothetical protein
MLNPTISLWRDKLARLRLFQELRSLGRRRVKCHCGYRGVAEKVHEDGYRCPKCRTQVIQRESASAIVGWTVVYLWVAALVVSRVTLWATHQDATWGGIGGELFGFLPIVLAFGPPVVALFLLWRWMRA